MFDTDNNNLGGTVGSVVAACAHATYHVSSEHKANAAISSSSFILHVFSLIFLNYHDYTTTFTDYNL